jgi:hypothetical protein
MPSWNGIEHTSLRITALMVSCQAIASRLKAIGFDLRDTPVLGIAPMPAGACHFPENLIAARRSEAL